MRVLEFEYPITRAITVILYHFRSEKKALIPEGAVQKALSIIIEGLKLNVQEDIKTIHTKQGWIIGGLNRLESIYYKVIKKKSKESGEHLGFLFEPKIELIEQDLKHKKIFLQSFLPRYVKPLSRFYKTKGGIDNLVFISMGITKDAGFYEIGDGLANATEKTWKLLSTNVNERECYKEFTEYIGGVSHKIELLKHASEYFERLKSVSEEDTETNLILSLAKFINSDDEDLAILLRFIGWLKDEIKELGNIAYRMREGDLIDLGQIKNKKEDAVYDSINGKIGRIHLVAGSNKSVKPYYEDMLFELYKRLKSWSYALSSAALLKNDKFRGMHWYDYRNNFCTGDKVIVWADGIGSSGLEGYLRKKYTEEEKTEVLALCNLRFHTIIRNFAIAFDALVPPIPPEGITINGDQIVSLYDSYLQALLGSSFTLFFVRQINKIIEDDPLKIGYKMLITHGNVIPGPVLDTKPQKVIKVVKPKECMLLEHTKKGMPREGYIIIDKEYHTSNIHLLGDYQQFIYKTKLTGGDGDSLIEVYSVDAGQLIRSFVEDLPFSSSLQ